MPGAYLQPLDIANRALDHIGATPITSFTQDVKAAQRVSSVYDKVRDAELRRNVWRFAIRKVALRAVDTTTVFLVPSAYVAADTYPQSSIVTFNNITYISAQYVPINTPPGNPNEAFWWVYFGPLTVQPWNPSPLVVPTPVTYYAGELVYNLVGTTVNVYQCLTTGTLADPTAAPPLWLATTTYDIGDTVTDAFAVVWQSKIDLNLNNAPVAGIAWQLVPADQPAQEVGRTGYRSMRRCVRSASSTRSVPGRATRAPPAMLSASQAAICAKPRKTPRQVRSAILECLADCRRTTGSSRETSSSRAMSWSSFSASWPISRMSPAWTRCSVRAWRHAWAWNFVSR